jgi:hypothetical protein
MIVTVFCASSTKIPDIYFSETQKIASRLTDEKVSFCYGGGAAGLMGVFADKVLEHHGEIIGIIPRFMIEMKWAHEKATSLIEVDDMHDRKRLLIEKGDAILVLPGGLGTMDELFEAATLKQLGQHVKPIILYNINNFFDPVISLFKHMAEERFIRHEHIDMIYTTDKPDEVLRILKNPDEPDHSLIDKAQI